MTAAKPPVCELRACRPTVLDPIGRLLARHAGPGGGSPGRDRVHYWHRPVSEYPSIRGGGRRGGPVRRGVLRDPGTGPAAPVRGAAGVPAGRRARRHGRATLRLHHHGPVLGGARLPGQSWRGPGLLRRPPARPEDRAGQGRRPRPDHRAARAGPLDRRDRHGAGPRRRRVEPHRDQRSDHRGRAAADLAPPRRRPRRAPPRRPAPGPCPGRRGLPRRHRPAHRRPPDPAGRAAARPAGPARPGPARPRRRGRIPRHPRHPRDLLPAVPARAQAHRDPAGLPRPRRGRRPGRRPVHRPDRAAQDDRADHLLLPGRPCPAGRVPHRAGQGRHPPGPGRRGGRQPRLPRRHALGPRPGTGEALRALTVPAHPQRADLLRRGRRQPRPALRQRRPREGQPGRGGDGLRRPLEDRHRPRPGPARHGLQGHHPGPALGPDRARDRVHHPASPHAQAHRRPAARCPPRPGPR